MKKINMKKIGIVLMLVILAIMLTACSGQPKDTSNDETKENVKNIEISVYDKSEELIYEEKIETEEEKLIGALKKIDDLNIVSEPSQYGEFITSIKGVEQGDNYFWNYYVNGEYATVGASEYEVQDNDIFEFRLEKFE